MSLPLISFFDFIVPDFRRFGIDFLSFAALMLLMPLFSPAMLLRRVDCRYCRFFAVYAIRHYADMPLRVRHTAARHFADAVLPCCCQRAITPRLPPLLARLCCCFPNDRQRLASATLFCRFDVAMLLRMLLRLCCHDMMRGAAATPRYARCYDADADSASLRRYDAYVSF